MPVQRKLLTAGTIVAANTQILSRQQAGTTKELREKSLFSFFITKGYKLASLPCPVAQATEKAIIKHYQLPVNAVMLVQKLNGCAEFIAGDGTKLRELLHPDKQPIELRYSLAHATLPVGQTTTPHSLRTSEVYYILSGRGEMHIDEETQFVEPGDAVYIPPNARQFIDSCGTEPLVFICIVDPAWRKEDETVY